MIVLLFAGSLFGQTDTGRRLGAGAGSSYRIEPDGLSAIYAALAAEGLARRWELPPHRLPDEVDRLVLWNPGALQKEAWTDLLDWVHAGQTLIIAGERDRFPGAPSAPADGSPVLVSWREGEGRVFWSADVLWLSNGRILEADNLDRALKLLTPRPGGQVAFNEYHHGFRQAERWWQILRGNLQMVALQLALALLLFYWAVGARFGATN